MAFGLAAGVFGFFVWKSSGFLVDDSFIYFRYAENIAAGNGFVFNPGEVPGEGFTSWAWLFFLTLCRVIGLKLTIASKILGLVFLIGGAGLFFFTVRHITGRQREGHLPAFFTAGLLLLHFPMVAHSQSGMETALYVFSLALMIYLFTLLATQDALVLKTWLFFILSIAFLFLVRPEGIVAGGLAFGTLWLIHKRTLFQPRIALSALFGLILPMGLFLVWKLHQFGGLFPLPFFHKRVSPHESIQMSLRHFADFFESYGWLVLLGLLCMVYAVFFRREKIHLFYGLLFILMTSLYLPFMPIMNYLDRYYIPYMMLILLLLGPGIGFLIDITKRFKTGGARLAGVSLAFFLIFIGMNSSYSTDLATVNFWHQMTDPRINRAKLGRLMSFLPPDLVIAGTEMGVIPYYSGLTCLDMAGLTDPVIGMEGLTMDYLMERGTDLILFPFDVSSLDEEWFRESGRSYEKVFRSEYFIDQFDFLAFSYAWPDKKTGYYFYLNCKSARADDVRAWASRYLEAKADDMGGP